MHEYQRVRAEMRANDAPEHEMDELFIEAREFVEELFSDEANNRAIGAFQGANYDAKAYYRSEMNCLMFTRTDHFCQVCSDAIEKVIDEYSRRPD